MATFIRTVRFADQGINGITATCNRAVTFQTEAEKWVFG